MIQVLICISFCVWISIFLFFVVVLDNKHGDAFTEIGFVDKRFFHLSCPHKQGADDWDADHADETGPVDEQREDLEMAHYHSEEPWEEQADEVLVTGNSIVFRADACKVFRLLLKVDGLRKHNDDYKYGQSYSDSIWSFWWKQHIVKKIGWIGEHHGTDESKKALQ